MLNFTSNNSITWAQLSLCLQTLLKRSDREPRQLITLRSSVVILSAKQLHVIQVITAISHCSEKRPREMSAIPGNALFAAATA